MSGVELAPNRQKSIELVVPNRLSYSSASKYAECGEKWRLEYGRGVTSGSWYATVAGSTIHHITEQNDRKRLGMEVGEIPTFREEFMRRLAIEEADGVKLKASGGKAAEKDELSWSGSPGRKGVEWWLHFGPQYVQQWEVFRDEHPELEILMIDGPDGTKVPAIELEFFIKVGDEWVRGFIDRVFLDVTTGNIIIVDLKTGKTPAGQLQLGDYGVGLLEQFGVKADYGAYWVVWHKADVAAKTETQDVPVLDEEGEPVLFKTGARAGQPKTRKESVEVSPAVPGGLASKLTDPTDLGLYTHEYMVARYEMARDGIMAGVFMPNVTGMCKGCGVSKFCRAVGGEQAWRFPVRELFIRAKEKEVREEELTDG